MIRAIARPGQWIRFTSNTMGDELVYVAGESRDSGTRNAVWVPSLSPCKVGTVRPLIAGTVVPDDEVPDKFWELIGAAGLLGELPEGDK